MKVLITGANGFVGSHLTENLLNNNHIVYALVRNLKKFNIQIDSAKKNNLFLIQGSIDQVDLSWINEIPSDIDACVHTAGIVHSYDEREFYRVNADASENLAKKLMALNPTLHFIYISSLAATGPSIGENPRQEDEIALPISDYGRSKKNAEELITKVIPQNALTIIRPPMVIGPRDQAVLDIFKMVKSRFVILPGVNSKNKKYSFVNVFDLVNTITLCLELKSTGSFFSAHPQIITFKDMIEKINKLFGHKVIFYIPLPLLLAKLAAHTLAFLYRFSPHNVRLTPDKYHELAASNFTCSGNKSQKLLSQKYKYDIDQTLKMAFDYYKNNKQI